MMQDLTKSLRKYLLPFSLTVLCHLKLVSSQYAQETIHAYSQYLQFIVLMMIFEAAISTLSFLKIHFKLTQQQGQKSGLDVSCYLNKEEYTFIGELRKYLWCILKTMILSSICYALYMVIFVSLSFTCNLYIQRASLQREYLVIENRNLENMDSILPQPHDIDSHCVKSSPQKDRILAPITSVTGQILSSLDISVDAIVISSDSNTAFLAVGYDQTGTNCSLQILNISNPQTPSSLGSVTFTMPANLEDQVFWDENTDDRLSLVLSLDEQTAFMTVAFGLQIIDVSNLMFPVIIGTFIPKPHDEPLDYSSIALSSDGNTAFVINNDRLDIINVTNPQSPHLITSMDNYGDVYSINVYEKLAFVGGSGWQIFNISNLKNIHLVGSWELSDSSDSDSLSPSVNSAVLSPDYNTAYLGVSGAMGYYSLKVVNTTDIRNPVTIASRDLSLDLMYFGIYLTISGDGRHLFVTGDLFVKVFDISDPASLVPLPDISISYPTYVAITSDGHTALVGNYDQLSIVQLYLNIETSLVAVDDGLAGVLPLNYSNLYEVDTIALSPDDTALYISGWTQPEDSILALNFTRPNSSHLYVLDESPTTFIISPDGETMVIITYNETAEYHMLQLYNITSTQYLSSFYGNRDSDLNAMTISSDGNILFVTAVTKFMSNVSLLAVDISNRTQPYLLSNITYTNTNSAPITLSPDGKTAFLGGDTLQICNVSVPSSPVFLGSYTGAGTIYWIAISPDGNTAFAYMSVDTTGLYNLLAIINISSLTEPSLISSLIIPDDGNPDIIQDMITVSDDGQTLFIVAGGLLVVDISDLETPAMVSYYTTEQPVSMAVTNDQSGMYLSDYSQGILALSLKPNYIVYLPSNEFPLGGSYPNSLNLLQKNSGHTYDASLISYKFTSASFFTISYLYGNPAPNTTYTGLPSWIDFDQTHGLLTFTPDSITPLGRYYMSANASTQVNTSVFVGIGSIATQEESNDLFIALLTLGYIDNDGFLTANFNPNIPLYLTSQYLQDEPDIRKALSAYFIEAITKFTVTSSLVLNPSSLISPISVNTLSLNPLYLNITLDTISGMAQFVNTDYSLTPSFANNNSVISAVGSLLDINTLLSQLIIFVSSSTPCNGTIIISDGLNPTLTQYIPNISDHFLSSSSPSINTEYFEAQIARVSVTTGEQFIIQLDPATFSDPNGETLECTLAPQDPNVPVPDWMTLKNFVLTGTPPDQLSEREINLKILVSNEYQTSEASFTIEVGISLAYGLKLASTYGGGFITLLGIFVYAGVIYNILCKKLYRYPKEFIVKVGEDATPHTIYPIPFVSGAMMEAKFIMKYLDKKLASELNKRSKSQIALYFVDPNTHELDQTKLIQVIEEVSTQHLNSSNSHLKLYAPGVNCKKDLINQLIIAEMTLRLLNNPEEKQTRRAFNAIKGDVFRLVNLENPLHDDICRFSVKKSKLYKSLRRHSLKIFGILADPLKDSSLNTSTQSLNTSSVDRRSSAESELLISDFLPIQANLNLKLLIKAIEAYAFKRHNLNVNAIDVEIDVLERLPTTGKTGMIKRFLKWDLQHIGFSKKGLQIGYGIKYKIKKGILTFYGTANPDIKDRTVVVQIKNIKGRILREIRIKGVDVEPEEDYLMPQTSEIL